MNSKGLLYLGAGVGATIGGWLPTLWGAGALSLTSILLGGVGGLVGIWAAYQITT